MIHSHSSFFLGKSTAVRRSKQAVDTTHARSSSGSTADSDTNDKIPAYRLSLHSLMQRQLSNKSNNNKSNDDEHESTAYLDADKDVVEMDLDAINHNNNNNNNDASNFDPCIAYDSGNGMDGAFENLSPLYPALVLAANSYSCFGSDSVQHVLRRDLNDGTTMLRNMTTFEENDIDHQRFEGNIYIQ